jgi:hypothetical protein
MQRPSLLDDDFESIGRRPDATASPRTRNAAKATLAAALFVCAGALMLWNAGLIGWSNAPVEPPPNQAKLDERADQIDLDAQATAALQKAGKVSLNGS